MDILDRLLGHDSWTTRQLLLRSRELSEEQLDTPFDIGAKSLRETFHHILSVMETHTHFLCLRTSTITDDDNNRESNKSLEALLLRLTIVSQDFADVALRVQREGKMDALITNP